jgi:glycosyltransferase involved in cell wall biosynthesis
MRRLKILAIAYACNPTRGSEFGVGWGWVNAIAAKHDITVLTANFNSTDIDRHCKASEPVNHNNPRFCYMTNRPWHYRPKGLWLRIEGSLAKPLMNLAYQDWLRYAFAEAKREVGQNHYDLVHLITYVGWRFPGKFYKLGLPFVWGPIGGMKNTPWRLLPMLGIRGAFYYGARNLINSLQLFIMRGPRRALRAAGKGVIAATSEIQVELLNRFKVSSEVICEVGPPPFEDVTPKHRANNEPLRLCWSGIHLPGKALHLLLRAAAVVGECNYNIEILGDGPSNRAWRSLAIELKIDDLCHWHGWIPRSESINIMKDSHAFVITSLKDLTSNVAVEAISVGLPIVCLDHCGFADLVTDNCGIKVYAGGEEQIISDLAKAIKKLYLDEPLRRNLARRALQRSQDYSWPNKMAALDRVYASVVDVREYTYAGLRQA